MTVQNCLNLLIVALWRHNNATGTGDRLCNKCGNGLGAFFQNHFLEIAYNTINKFRLRFISLFTTVIVRMISTKNTKGIHRQIKMVLSHRQASEGCRCNRDTMIGAITSNYFPTLRLSDSFMVVTQ